ncbi:Uncharacterised protein [[Clostridium] sordellii]|nr:Uncharacterised protein [[Clostridium] sordellii] [Paeniclostridium sordellii]
MERKDINALSLKDKIGKNNFKILMDYIRDLSTRKKSVF